MSHTLTTDEDLVRQDNAMRRALIAANAPKTWEQRQIDYMVRERRMKALADARNRLRERGIDPDTL